MSTLPLLFFSQQFFVIAYCLEHYCNIVQHYCNIVERHWRYYEHIAVIVSQLFSSVVLSRQYYLLFIKYSPRSYHKYIFPLFPIISISPLSYHKYFSSFLHHIYKDYIQSCPILISDQHCIDILKNQRSSSYI